MFCRGYEVESWSRFWTRFWILSLVEMLMFGWNFEVDAWSRFWRWNLIKICVWIRDITSRSYYGKMNSILGSVVPLAMFFYKGLTLVQALGSRGDRSLLIDWFLLRLSDFSLVGNITDHGRILYQTKPNANTAVCHWIMIWCSFLLTKIDVMMYIVQDRWGLLADENRESLGAVNCVILDQELL